MCSCGCGGSHKHDELVPMVGVITDIKDQTPDVKTFRVERPEGGKLFEHMPGQCAMISVPGVGEAMFSITSSPTNKEYQEFSIKRCGTLTDYLHTMEVGDELTVRGPYCNAFPVETVLKGQNLLFVAGGIGLAPLRSVINYVMDNRENYGTVDILYGSRSKEDLVGLDEIQNEWTKDKGVNIYTHSEMLPAHGYPKLKAYPQLKGNFGTGWQNQQSEFHNIPAPILFTTNCIMPVRQSYCDRVFTTSIVSYPELVHIGDDKDFTPVIEKAIECGGYDEDREMTGMNGGHTVTTGFAHNAVLSNAEKIISLVKEGRIKHFFLIGGCDGASPSRSYYSDFARLTPPDSLILTLACGKYRINDMDLGTIDGIPRILDCGQCNDAYSAIKIALALAEAFDCDVNDLPLTLVLSWYEQKAVCILLTLLSLGIKNIYLGPTLPAFVSKGVLDVLVDKFQLTPISTPEEDIKKILG